MKPEIPRQNAIKIIGLSTLSLLLNSCNIDPSKISSSSTPDNGLLELQKYYTLPKEIPLTQRETLFSQERDIELFNFSNISINTKALTDLYTFFDQTVIGISQLKFGYPNNNPQFDFSFESRAPLKTYLIIIPADFPNKPDWVTTQATSQKSNELNAYITHAIDPTIKTFATEACQTTLQARSFVNTKGMEPKQAQAEATRIANLMQEIGCNSLGLAIGSKSLNNSYEQFVQRATNTTVGPDSTHQYPLWILPKGLYDVLPKLNLFK